MVDLYDEMTGRMLAEVKTAIAMTDDLRSQVTEQLTSQFGKSVRLREVIDESLIGGMVVRVGDTVFDSSVASRLDKLGKAAASGFARQLMNKSDMFTTND